VNPFGADHQSHEHDPSYEEFADKMAQLGLTNPQPTTVMNEEKVKYSLITQYLYSCLDTVNVCQFVFGPSWQLYGTDELVEAMQKVTGWDVTLDELLELGARRLNMLRAFNAREGLGRSEDTLPRKLQKALIGGPSDGLAVSTEEFEQAKDWYYEMAGWEVETGLPTRARLEELGLDWVADLIEV
jgi:aldehyde:ferredoxin oxidoreductase